MQIHISGQQIDVGDALRVHVTDKLNAGVAKFFDHSLEANVAFSRDGEGFACVASVHVFAGLTLRAEGHAADIYAAFDQSADRIEKRLRRYKERLKSHKGRGAEPELEARDVVLQAEPDDTGEAVNGEPVVVAESVAAISTLRVGDAVMRLDISGAPVLVFRNAGHGALNVVYRRSDGHIGWIDPSFDPKH